MSRYSVAKLGLLVTAIVAGGFGCELLAQIDRSQISGTSGSGGNGGGGASATSTASSSSSGGGLGGAGGGTGGTGGVGGGMPCDLPTDCPDPKNECLDRTCTANTCGQAPRPVGTLGATQTAGDCQKSQCDGAGKLGSVADDADLPVDALDCTDDVCTAGVASNPAKPASSPCGQGGLLFCDGAGKCVGCNAPTDCAGADTECAARTCTAGACGVANAPQGKVVSAQTAGNCQKDQCDGGGAVEAVPDTTDLPVDGKTCTQDVCTAGVPSNPPVAVGVACSEGSGILCDGAGKCAACLIATDCAGVDTECQQRSCTAGVCGVTFTPLGTALTTQTASDCMKAVCDGAGGITAQNDDTDLPNDNNVCTSDVCTSGVSSHANAANGSSCGGTLACLNGLCAGCGQPSDCPGVDDECKARSCTVGVCGFNFTTIGTAVAAQTAGNCQKNQCDGAGNIASATDNTDVPADDGSQCTAEICTAGAPSHPAVAANTACNQGGGSFCSAGGTCVQCIAATQCAGTDTECHTRTCTANACGVSNTAAGTVTTAQTAGDCQKNQCDGAGNSVSSADDTDLPVDDGNQCTGEICTAGAPSHPAAAVNTACNQGGGSFCSAGGSCVQCNAAAQCAGTDTECHTRTCTANTCGANNTPAGTPTIGQTSGDCQKNQCDGAGNIVNAADDTDLPADDLNQCTGEICTAGVPSHPAVASNTACNQGGGSFCNGGGTCVQCNLATQCAGTDTECHTRTCTANTCGANNTAAGTPTIGQTAGDCQKNQCDGAGNSVSSADNTDLPADDLNQCTGEICTAGVPSHPSSPAGTACNQSGGTVCDGAGTCAAAPQVASTSPSDATLPVAAPPVEVTFTIAMNPATLTGQTTAGACSGSIQVSLDNFASCVAFSSAPATMSGGNTMATLTTAPGLLVNRIYKIRVTTAAASATGNALGAQFTTATGFTTTSPSLCAGSLVMSQVFGGGGNSGAQYTHDFVELHNRGTTTLSLVGMSLQYTSSAGTIWNGGGLGIALLSGSIPPGGYFLVKLATGGAVGAALPTPDLTPAIALPLSATNGKIALINSTTQIANGACPPAATTVDFVGYGSADCKEGSSTVAVLSNSTAALRAQSGCADVNNNGADFSVAAPVPRNGVTAVAACTCAVANESNAALEPDYCTVQFPLSLSTQTGTATALVYGRIYEAGTTEAAGAPVNVRAQLGYGLPTLNPEYEAGWTWTNATYNATFVDPSNDEYQASFTAPAVGSYRYAYRFSLDQGVSWTVCDQNAGDGGAGSNPGLLFAFADEPTLTVTP